MKEKRTKRFADVLIGCLILTALCSMILSRYALTVSRYTVSSAKLTAPLRIVQLSDLHNSVFGENNRRLVKKVAAQEPDLILITGDLLDQNEDRTDIAASLITALSSVAPVYVSYGNHELEYEKSRGQDLRALYTETGATVLEYDWEDLSVKGQELRVGGLYGYCLPAVYLTTHEASREECAFLAAFQDTERYSILLCHMPYSWLTHDALESWTADCVLSGHIHGGQIRLPWLGGLWAPDQGWFPGRVCGLYHSADESRVLLLSRGLGNTDMLPRLNNIPEIVVLDLLPEGGASGG